MSLAIGRLGRAARRAAAERCWACEGARAVRAAVLLGALGGLLGACSSSAAPAESEPAPGYPAATSRLTLRVNRDFQKLCHATLVDSSWALTAAHCFSGVDPSARGALNDFERGVAAADVILHPGALRSGATMLDGMLEKSDFVAAHDLALIPISPPIDDVAPVSRWLPRPGCSLAETLQLAVRFGQLGPNDEAQTVEATLLGTVEAAALLGPDHVGSLLSAQGPRVRPGDSGSGVTVTWSELEGMAQGCARSSEDGDEILIGVVQDANVAQSTLPFGLTPLYPFDHSRWLATVIESSPLPTQPERPRLDP